MDRNESQEKSAKGEEDDALTSQKDLSAQRSEGDNKLQTPSQEDVGLDKNKYDPAVVEISPSGISQRKDLISLCYDHFHHHLPAVDLPLISFPQSFDPFILFLDDWFECSKLGSSVALEIFCGIIHFFSCMYCLPVISQQMASANYDVDAAYAIICLIIGLGSIITGLFTNTPLIIAPPTAVSIFFTSSIQSQSLTPLDGNMAVTMSGVAMVLLALLGPLGSTLTLLIPECIQASTTVGIGLLTALAGATEIELVVRGEYTLLEVGKLTNEVIIALTGLAVLGMAVTRHSRFAYILGLAYGTILWWIVEDDWPKKYTALPTLQSHALHAASSATIDLIFSLIFLNILTLYGLARALCDLAGLTNSSDGTSIPRGRILILIIGLCNILSGVCYGPPIILSPESVGGIKAGAKTGLSAIVGGILFLFSIFWGPFFTHIPSAGTSPVLIVIGLFLFLNIYRINFKEPKDGIPAFCCLFFISFTNSILCGLSIGYAMYGALHLFTGDLYYELKDRSEFIWNKILLLDERDSDGRHEDKKEKENGQEGKGSKGDDFSGSGEETTKESDVQNQVLQQTSLQEHQEETSSVKISTPVKLTLTVDSDDEQNQKDQTHVSEEGKIGSSSPSAGSSSPSSPRSSPRFPPSSTSQSVAPSSGPPVRKAMKRHRSFQEVSIAIVKHISEDVNAESGINTPVMP
jgi:adenine/guanine/hypoxanthine permease